MTLQLLWEHVEAHPGQRTYRYTEFCQRYRDRAAALKRSMRQQHRVGEKLFAGQTVPVLGRDGGVAFKAHVFSAVIGARTTPMHVRRVPRPCPTGSAA